MTHEMKHTSAYGSEGRPSGTLLPCKRSFPIGNDSKALMINPNADESSRQPGMYLFGGYAEIPILGKGYSGKRANALARSVSQWEELRAGERWIAPTPTPLHYYRRTQTAVMKWKTEQGAYRHSLLTTSLLDYSLAALAEAYNPTTSL